MALFNTQLYSGLIFNGKLFGVIDLDKASGRSGVNRLWLAQIQAEALKKWDKREEEVKVEAEKIITKAKTKKKPKPVKIEEVEEADEPLLGPMPLPKPIKEVPPVRESINPIMQQIRAMYLHYNVAVIYRQDQILADEEDDELLLLMAAS